MRTRIFAAAVASLLFAACDKATRPSAEAELAASFERLASELRRSGDLQGASIATHAALMVRTGATLGEVTIKVDGTEDRYSALMSEMVLESDDPPEGFPLEPFTVRTLIAWRGARIDRLLHVTTFGESGSFRNLFGDDGPIDIDPLLPSPALGIIADGRNVLWVAVSGEASSRRTGLGAECRLPPPPPGSPARPPITCNKAEFAADFAMTAEPAPTLTGFPNTRLERGPLRWRHSRSRASGCG